MDPMQNMDIVSDNCPSIHPSNNQSVSTIRSSEKEDVVMEEIASSPVDLVDAPTPSVLSVLSTNLTICTSKRTNLLQLSIR